MVVGSPDSPRLRQVVVGLREGLGGRPLKVVCLPEFGREGDDLLRGLRQEKPRLFIVLGTSALMRLAPVEKGIPAVFAMVADPYYAGAAYDARHPDRHQFNITGIASPAPVSAALEQGTKLLGVRVWGMLVDPLDGRAVELAEKFITSARALGLTALVEQGSDLAGDRRGLERLLARGARVIYLPPAASAARYAPLLLSWGQAGKVLVVNSQPEIAAQGAILSVTLDYVQLGEETARLAQRVLQGERPSDIAIKESMPLKISVDEILLRHWSSYPGSREPVGHRGSNSPGGRRRR